MHVDEVIDLVDSAEVIGRIGDARIHLRCPPNEETPIPGAQLRVYANRLCDFKA
jgi:hypothetical protein